MDSLSPLRRLHVNYLSRAYALMYAVNRRSFLGVRLSAIIRWLPVLTLLVGWIRHWSVPVMVALLLIIIWINYSLWRAKRDNYNRFVPDQATLLSTPDLESLPPNRKIAVRATGLFSISGRQGNLLLRPAEYWRVPLGEHVVMAEEQPGKFLYQFFSAQNLQEVRPGWLLFGSRPVKTLAITFLARWGPEYTRFGQVYEDGDDSDLPPAKQVTIYLSAPDLETHQAIWQTIVTDARNARLGVA